MLLAVRISSYGCTWEDWRPLKKLESLLSAIAWRNSYASFVLSKLPACIHNSIPTLSMNQFLNILKIAAASHLAIRFKYNALLQNVCFVVQFKRINIIYNRKREFLKFSIQIFLLKRQLTSVCS